MQVYQQPDELKVLEQSISKIQSRRIKPKIDKLLRAKEIKDKSWDSEIRNMATID